MSERVKISDQDAQALRERPVAKGKRALDKTTDKALKEAIKADHGGDDLGQWSEIISRKKERELETNVQVIRTRKPDANAKPELHGVSGGAVKGVVEETMARVYGEIYSGMSTHDDEERVITDISEEAYVLTLTMVVGNDIDLPRQGLRMKDDDTISTNMKSCKECAA